VAAVAGAATWLVLYKLFRISSVGSLAGVAVALGLALFTADQSALYGLVGVALLIVLRHRGNIRRLLARQGG
jgi:glycerol-3-phosphate acyltransferase PlsY